MLGAIVGDIIGSCHEWTATRTKVFPLFAPGSHFTDDTVLTVAVAEWLLTGGDLTGLFHDYFEAWPDRRYGGRFLHWALERRTEPYQSFGNGSAMRVSPVGFAFETLDEVLDWARRSAEVTHDHPEGIRGAQATAAAVFLARRRGDRDAIRSDIESRFGYDLSTPLDAIRPTYGFDETCPGTVPQALRAFLEATDYEDALRNAISLGGDADTLAAIAGGVAGAYFGVPSDLATPARALLDPRLAAVVDRFHARYPGAAS